MPSTRAGKKLGDKTPKVKSKKSSINVRGAVKNPAQPKGSSDKGTNVGTETAYEKLLKKVNAKRKQEEINTHSKAKKKRTTEVVQVPLNEISTQFIEDENYVEMEVLDEDNQEFPSPSEEESEIESEDEETNLTIQNPNIMTMQL